MQRAVRVTAPQPSPITPGIVLAHVTIFTATIFIGMWLYTSQPVAAASADVDPLARWVIACLPSLISVLGMMAHWRIVWWLTTAPTNAQMAALRARLTAIEIDVKQHDEWFFESDDDDAPEPEPEPSQVATGSNIRQTPVYEGGQHRWTLISNAQVNVAGVAIRSEQLSCLLAEWDRHGGDATFTRRDWGVGGEQYATVRRWLADLEYIAINPAAGNQPGRWTPVGAAWLRGIVTQMTQATPTA